MNEKIINGLNNEELTEEELEKVSGGNLSPEDIARMRDACQQLSEEVSGGKERYEDYNYKQGILLEVCQAQLRQADKIPKSLLGIDEKYR